ncbi:MAG: 2-oxo acid dehydrogenase subunit E2 [Caldilineaceae bacterium]|nr:2-oxo acid dehydrogenase subunit E2 [Caldilineaceae bacterium]
MPKEVIMPALGMAQETGELLRWFVEEGATVKAGEPLMEVATDKVDETIEATASGVLAGVLAKAGDDVPVGQVIAYILAPGETAPLPSPPRGGEGADSGKAKTTPPDAAPLPQSEGGAGGGGVLASPVAARMAAEHGIDLAAVPAKGGRVQKEDVAAYLESQKATPADGRVLASPKARRLAEEKGVELSAISGSGPDAAVLAADVENWEPLPSSPQFGEGADQARSMAATGSEISISRGWQVMAQRLTESWTTVPHFYLVREVDAGALQAWRTQALARSDVKITVSDLLVKVTAIALSRHPRVNASWINGKIVANPSVNLGLAVAVEDGLLVPVLPGAEGLGLREIASQRAGLVERAQTGKLALADLSGGTFTISNLGMFGVDAFNAIVNPPQAAILAVGKIADRVVAVDGQPAVRPMLTLTLSCDHRVVDGARAARFLDELAGLIEDPLRALE